MNCFDVDMTNVSIKIITAGYSVGKKLDYAILMDEYEAIAVDVVAVCANELISKGAKPITFEAHIVGNQIEEKVKEILVKNITESCQEIGITTLDIKWEKPTQLFKEKAFSISGFSVGVITRGKCVEGDEIKAGDVLIGIRSNGIHTSGLELVQKLYNPTAKTELEAFDKDFLEPSEVEILKPTQIYVNSIVTLLEKVKVKGIANVTEGGLFGGISQILPDQKGCVFNTKSYEIPLVFQVMQERAGITDKEAYSTFNMGIGMVLFVEKQEVECTLNALQAVGEIAVVLGEVTDGMEIELK